MTSERDKAKRRWWQLRIRDMARENLRRWLLGITALFSVIALCGVVLAWLMDRQQLRMEVQRLRVQHRTEAAAKIDEARRAELYRAKARELEAAIEQLVQDAQATEHPAFDDVIGDAPVLARPQTMWEYGQQIPSFAFGRRFITSVDLKRLRETPEWKPNAENPPISARRALALADEVVRDLEKGESEWSAETERFLDAVSLFLAGENRWFWRVEYFWLPRTSGSSGTPPNLCLYVLMDGMVVKPQEVEWGPGPGELRTD